MLYVKPHFYDQFQCIADRCPDTCCAGWQIMIDEESLLKYSRIEGGFGNRLMTSIDWEEGAFLQFDGRCSCLNEKNLCDLYEELGEEYLCSTCRMYPRHVEEYEDVREWSLSLSCPEAARMILECEEPLTFLTEETGESEPEPDESFDFLLYSSLNEIREILFRMIQNREEAAEVRMKRCLTAGKVCQKALEEGGLFGIEEELEQIRQEACGGEPLGFEAKSAFLRELFEMEFLCEDWKKEIHEAFEILYENGQEAYEKIREKFGPGKWEQYSENLMMFFIYTYFCGAVYDDSIDTKICLAVYSTVMIHELSMARWIRQGKSMKKEEIWETAWRYAREIEHSDQNLAVLETYFQKGPDPYVA